MSEFYYLYKSFEQQELFDVLLNPGDYQPEAVECAKQVLREKRWSADFQKVLDEKKEEQQQEAEDDEEDNLAKADYYRKAVEIKMQNHAYSILLGDVSKFEAKLAELNIEYFREDNQLNPRSYSGDYQTYYFKSEDTDKVDAMGKELGVFAAVYNTARKNEGLQLKFLGIILVAFIIVYAIYYLFHK